MSNLKLESVILRGKKTNENQTNSLKCFSCLLACLLLFVYFLPVFHNKCLVWYYLFIWVFVTNLAFSKQIPDSLHKKASWLFSITWQIFKTKHKKHDNNLRKHNVGSFGLGKKSLGSDTNTETWSWFQLPIPKLGFGRTLNYRMNYGFNQ